MDIDGTTVALVTGGASGMGAATARLLAGAGAPVALLDRDADGVAAVADEVGGLGVPCDVADDAAVEKAFDQVVADLGPPRILVNCAGLTGTRRLIDRNGEPMPMGHFEWVLRINLFGTFNTIRLFVSRLVKLDRTATGERGVIVNTASSAAFEGLSGGVPYSASKGGVMSMTMPLARELGPYGIRAVCIAPGTFGTGLLSQIPNDTIQGLLADVPFPNDAPGDPTCFAKLVMAAVDNIMLNGAVIRLDAAGRPREPRRSVSQVK
jgi:NAD(P)-dependent dehydrogenase (short-subunit alcohol dehydrogenase family)